MINGFTFSSSQDDKYTETDNRTGCWDHLHCSKDLFSYFNRTDSVISWFGYLKKIIDLKDVDIKNDMVCWIDVFPHDCNEEGVKQ